MLRFLFCGALALAFAQHALAQPDCFEKLLASIEEEYQTQGGEATPGTIPKGDTIIRLKDNSFYLARNKIPTTDEVGSSNHISPTGEVTNCDAKPEECRELLEEAFDGGGSEPSTPADPPAEGEPAPQSLPGATPEYHYEFNRLRDGSIRFAARGGRGVWGYRYAPRLCE